MVRRMGTSAIKAGGAWGIESCCNWDSSQRHSTTQLSVNCLCALVMFGASVYSKQLRLLSEKKGGILSACGKLSKTWNFKPTALVSALVLLNEASGMTT